MCSFLCFLFLMAALVWAVFSMGYWIGKREANREWKWRLATSAVAEVRKTAEETAHLCEG